MNFEHKIEKYYSVADHPIKIISNCPDWAESLELYLALKPTKQICSEPLILKLYESDQSQLENIMPLPGDQHLLYEATLMVDCPLPYHVYGIGNQRWIDLQGLGRAHIDLDKKQASAVRVSGNIISPIYINIIFGFNSLLTLFSYHSYQVIHASCVEICGQGLLFTGKSGSGKSTAAYALLRRGHSILADDRILLRRDNSYQALSISDVIKIEIEAQKYFFPELRNHQPLQQVGSELYYKISSLTNFSYQNCTTINYLFIFERTYELNSRLEKVNPSRVVGELFPVTMSLMNPKIMEDKFDFLMDFIASIKCYRIYFGYDMEQFVFIIENLLQVDCS